MKTARSTARGAGSLHTVLVGCAAVVLAYWETLAAVVRRLP